MSELVSIRPSEHGDVAAIAAIYRHHVLHGIASFEDEPPEPEEIARRRAEIIARSLPYLVAERGGQVLGYCYASPYRIRSAYRYTVEDSIYIDRDQLGRGIGRALLSQVIEHCVALGYRQMVAVIGGREQWPSIRLHRRLGFVEIGTLRAIGFKFGGWIDTVLMQRSLGDGTATPPMPSRMEGENG